MENNICNSMILTSRRRHFYSVGQSKHKVGACGVNNQASVVLAGNELPFVAFSPDGHGYELVSSVRALVPQMISVEEELMHVKHVEVKSPHVGVMWKFGRGVISSEKRKQVGVESNSSASSRRKNFPKLACRFYKLRSLVEQKIQSLLSRNETKIRCIGCQLNESLIPRIKQKRVNGNAISENTPRRGGQRRKKPNENETEVMSRGREWKSAGRGRKAKKRVRGAPKRSREKELMLFFYAARIKRMESASRNLQT
ncbi:hypothetical protein TNCV_2892241 [Trichonephila clavipes]|nr:hypothetical protein TNCV_2892241 [Trichonephila clavipes]